MSLSSKKPSKTEVLRSYGIYNHSGFDWLRYKNPPEKGIYWYLFSQYIRNRDVEAYGTCISCGKPITVDTCDAGHFMPAKDCGRDLLFDPVNVNAECGSCNAFDETHLLGYAEGLDARYGAGTALKLRQRRDEYRNSPVPIKDWKAHEYAEKIRSLPTYKHSDCDGAQ